MIFEGNLEKMHLADCRVKPSITPMMGFTGSTTITITTIKLPVYVGRMTKIVKFLMINKPVIYNVILETSWLHLMKAVTSMYY